MAITRVKSKEIGDGGVKRSDLNTLNPNDAVITKVIAGENIELSSTGVDAGTGDVTIKSIPPATKIKVTQAAHLLTAGNIVRMDITGLYKKAKADNSSNAEVVGYVEQVIDPNTFYLVTHGIVNCSIIDEDPGTVMYLDPVTAGNITAIKPTLTGHIVKPVGIVTQNKSKMLFYSFPSKLIGTTIDNSFIVTDSSSIQKYKIIYNEATQSLDFNFIG